MQNRDWYNSLKKSTLTPPNWVFGTAWSLLYTSMVIYLVLMMRDEKCNMWCQPLTFFAIQLFFNLIWTSLFFKFKMIRLALIDILFTLGFTITTFITSLNINSKLSIILIPYILWLTLATYLNTYIVFNN